MNTLFPTIQEVIEIHQLLITAFGGSPGIREMGGLEAALMRPQLGYYKNTIEQAAALMESLANNHPFIDGNKRVAFFVTDIFLRMNRRFIDCDNEKAYTYFMELFEEKKFNFQELKIWLEKNTQTHHSS